MKGVSLSQVFDLVSVRPPYFHLSDVRVDGTKVQALLPEPTKSIDELGALTAAEAARHMAILGSYACALANPVKTRHYYLAKRGEIQSYNFLAKAEKLIASGEGKVLDRQTAVANIQVCNEYGETIFACEVTYQVVSKKVFERIFSNQKLTENEMQKIEEYISGPFQLFDYQFKDEPLPTMHAKLGDVKKEYCMGHFDYFPCLPIAYLLGTMASAAGDFLGRILDKKISYVVRDAVSNAEQLAFAGEVVEIAVEYMGNFKKGCHSFKGRAFNKEKEYGELYITLMEVEMNQSVDKKKSLSTKV